MHVEGRWPPALCTVTWNELYTLIRFSSTRRCAINANRISVIGSLIAASGFFFLPLLEIKPNRLASGLTVNLLELQTDYRYVLLFMLSLVPIAIALQANLSRRAIGLVIIGNLMLFLTLLLPAWAATDLLETAETIFPEGTQISNPRIFTSSAIAIGLLGSYIVLFGGLMDMRAAGAGQIQRLLSGTVGILGGVFLFVNGNLDNYSILVEFNSRGETLGERFVEHFVFVIVSLMAGLVIGILLGLWAARDERMGSVILYAVGIIQTIPSLALFGVLLVPLARLGDRQFTDVLDFFLVSLFASGLLLFLISRFLKRLPGILRTPALIGGSLAIFVPLALFSIIAITFGFEAMLEIFKTRELSQYAILAFLGVAAFPILLAFDRNIDTSGRVRWLNYARYALLFASMIGFVALFIEASGRVMNDRSVSELTIRDLGVSGIGTAPALIALTLYSLLPLVRNTYAGLNNIDPAVIDSGRGMGMTPAQIFRKIELPMAFPVIMAGVRNAGISLVGIAAVASIIGAGALGDFILLGVNTTSVDLILLGAIPAIILAIILDALLQIFEALFTSPGIRFTPQ